jgi:hypothetical protein
MTGDELEPEGTNMNRIIESHRPWLAKIRFSLVSVRSGLRKNQDCAHA